MSEKSHFYLKRNNSVLGAALLLAAATPMASAAEVIISGAVEAEAVFSEGSSDLAIATVEVGVDTMISDKINARLLFLYEEGGTPLEVDEATITYKLGKSTTVTIGQQYIPFGSFQTGLVSDPLTLELGETRESAAVFGYEAGGGYGSVYVFNGDSDVAGTDNLKHFGAQVGVKNEADKGDYNFGASYTSAIVDSNLLQDTVGVPTVESPAGAGFHATYRAGAFRVIGEYVMAMGAVADLGGAMPSAMNVEANYETTLGGRDATWAVAYQATAEADVLGLPESRIAGAVAIGLGESAGLGIEVAQETDYAGTSTSSVTLQLATEF